MNKKRKEFIIKTKLLLVTVMVVTLFFITYLNSKNLSNISALVNLSGCLTMVGLVVNFYKRADKLIDEEKE